MSTINGVLGPIDSAGLGFTLMHEHVAAGSAGVWQAWPELFGGREAHIERVAGILVDAKAGGLRTFVDVTTIDLGRDIRLIRDVAERSGVNIIACTGHWLDPSRSMAARTVEELTALFVKEIEQGIEGTTIKAGILKLANDDTPRLSRFGEKAARAVARAHLATGVPITTHAGAKLEIGFRQAEVFEEEGVAPRHVIIGHSDDTDSMHYLTGLMDKGYWVGLDRLPMPDPPFAVRAGTCAALIERGYADQHGSAIEAGTDPLPDVVLEVDHTTDVRRRKLSLYEEGGFAEVWVLVTAQSRWGLARVTIHVLDGGAYRVAPQSAAIPGWKSEEIHRALTEDPWSESTRAALERVALAMGAREGTTPEDDPHSRSLIRRGRVEGQREGYAEGRRDGEARGRREERAAMVLAMLRARGIEVSPDLEEDLEALAGDVPAAELMTAVQTCTDEADFFRRVRESIR